MPKPVLAAVNGPAVGIGCSLALACDLVLARESAYLLLAFVNIGLAPDGGSSVFVPARAGAGRAATMALLGERIPAPQASAWGLVDRLVSDDSFDAEVDALAEQLATGPTQSYAAAKAQLNARVYAGLDEQLELEASLQEQMVGSADFVEGVAPSWRSAAPASPATELSRPASQYTARRDGPLPPLEAAPAGSPGRVARPSGDGGSGLRGAAFPEAGGGSPGAEDIRTLYIIIFIIGFIVFLGVEGVLIWCLVKYRAKRGRVAAQIHGNTKLEIGWTVGAAVILVFLTIATFVMLPGIKNPAPSSIDENGNPVASNAAFASTDQPRVPGGHSMNIEVNGKQYVWQFTYPGDEKVFSYTRMYVPCGDDDHARHPLGRRAAPPGGSRSSAARWTPCPATPTRPGSR